MRTKRPHIIILNPDEMRWNTMGHMGNAAADTPCLDQLAESEAVSFSHAYCQNPVCVPSRCSFLTGLYPHTTGHRTMSYLMHEGESSLFSELKKAGYHVWLNGRNDFLSGNVNDLEELHASEVYYYDETEADTEVSVEEAFARLTGKAANAGTAETAQDPRFDSLRKNPYSFYEGVVSGAGEADLKDTRAAIRRIRTIGDLDGKPLCLFLGWSNPHPAYAVMQEYYDRIDPEKVPETIDPVCRSGKSLIFENLQTAMGLEHAAGDDFREIQRVYLAQTAMVDEMTRMILDALKQAGIYDDCAIFFLSDHGDFAGDYHIPEKAQNTFEDVLVRVPLLIKPPKNCPVDPGVSESIAELVDFYATVMDYAQVPPDHTQFGKSLRPVVEDRTHSVRSFACAEGGRLPGETQADEWHSFGESGLPEGTVYYPRLHLQEEDAVHEKGTMITDGHWKYVHRLSGKNEFYDLQADPQELHNLYGNPDDDQFKVIRQMQTQLLDWYQHTCDTVPFQMDTRFTEKKIWSVIRDLVPRRREQEARAYIRANHPDFGSAIRYAAGLLAETAVQKKTE